VPLSVSRPRARSILGLRCRPGPLVSAAMALEDALQLSPLLSWQVFVGTTRNAQSSLAIFDTERSGSRLQSTRETVGYPDSPAERAR
jgi:hypothetical protein